MKRIIPICILLLNVSMCWAQHLIQSPDEKVRVTLHTNKARTGVDRIRKPTKMTMKVFNEKDVLADKEIGLTVKHNGKRHVFGKSQLTYATKRVRQTDQTDKPASLDGTFNELTLGTDNGIKVEVRVYNNGVAYRYHVTGYADEYKILEVCNPFPEEKSAAILGTYSGAYTSPWHTLKIGDKQKGDKVTPTTTISEAVGRKTKIVPWKDALSSISVGVSANWYNGDTWGSVDQDVSFTADFTYKHIYGGLSYTPCKESMYIHYDGDFWPFENVIGSIHSWSLGMKAGYCLPLQNGHDMWNIIPYVSASVMHLKQHGTTRIGYKTVDPHNHYLVGPGIKLQFIARERLSLGIAYEYQFFTDRKAPTGKNSFMLSLGKMF